MKPFLYGNIYQDHYTRESKVILMLDQQVHFVHGNIKLHQHCQTRSLTQKQFQGYHFCANTVTCTYARNVLTGFTILQVCLAPINYILCSSIFSLFHMKIGKLDNIRVK